MVIFKWKNFQLSDIETAFSKTMQGYKCYVAVIVTQLSGNFILHSFRNFCKYSPVI